MKRTAICKDFVRKYHKGQKITACSSAAYQKEVWGISLDWHDMGMALEELVCSDEAILCGLTNERLATYFIP